MPDTLTAQVVAPFGIGELPSPPISIEGDPGIYSDDDVHLLVLCPAVPQVTCDVGSVRITGSKSVEVQGGVLSFSGSNTSSLPSVPFTKGTTLKVLMAFNELGQRISVNVKYIPQRFVVEASRPFYGAVSYTAYEARGFTCLYTPVIEQGSGGTSKVTYGMIAAFAHPHSITTYQVQPANLSTGAVELEIYRVISKAVTNKDGEFERPPNFPTDGNFPGKSLVIDVTTAMETERAHEIGYIDPVTGFCRVTPYFVPIREPYQLDTGYKPIRSCIVSNLGKDIDPQIVTKAQAFVKSRDYGCK